MTNVYEGPPDARQSDDVKMPVTRFRPRYRALTDAEKAHHDAIKTKADELGRLFEDMPQGRETALAFTKLEEAIMWAIKGLTK